MHLDARQLRVYYQGSQVAQHRRDYGRHGDFENPDHPKALLAARHKARAHKAQQSFFQLGLHAEAFYLGLQERRLNAPTHLRKILALEGTYTRQQITEALSDAHQIHAYSSEYIINMLGQREHPKAEPSPLHLTRLGDQLDIETPRADLSIYDNPPITDEQK